MPDLFLRLIGWNFTLNQGKFIQENFEVFSDNQGYW